MIQEGIAAIVDLANRASAKIAETKHEPSGTYYVLDGTGKMTKTKADVAPRAHKVDSIETIVAFAERFPDTAAVWLGFEGVTVLMDDETRRESARLALKPSKQFETLAKFDGEGWRNHPLTQAELILLLRTTFARTASSSGFLSTVRSLRFRSAAEGTGNIQHGKSSIGKQVEQQVSGEKEIPETVVFDIPVFESGFYVLAKVEVAIDINIAGERFHLIPLPGELAAVKEHACGQIEKHLLDNIDKDAEVHDRVYRGQP